MLLHNNIGDIQFHFMTPLTQRMWPAATAHKNGLQRQIMHHANLNEGVEISNHGGWQSRDDLLSWPGKEIQAFSKWVSECIVYIYDVYHGGQLQALLTESGTKLDFNISAWANLNRRGNFNAIHNHHSSHWSGVYYLEAPENCGDVSFLDPRHGVNMMSTQNKLLDIFSADRWEIEPKEGMTVIFPSWLYHWVDSNNSDQDRISIAFNVAVSTVTTNT